MAAALAGICCVLISCGVIMTQCVVRRRKRMKELKAKKDMAEMEGVDMSVASDDIKSDTDDPDKKPKKSTTEMREYALDKKSKDHTGVIDMSGDGEKEGSRREMMSEFRVQAIDDDAMSHNTKGKVGNHRFDLDQ